MKPSNMTERKVRITSGTSIMRSFCRSPNCGRKYFCELWLSRNSQSFRIWVRFFCKTHSRPRTSLRELTFGQTIFLHIYIKYIFYIYLVFGVFFNSVTLTFHLCLTNYPCLSSMTALTMIVTRHVSRRS